MTTKTEKKQRQYRIEPHLYCEEGARAKTYFTRIDGKREPLGTDLAAARAKLRVLLELPSGETTIRAMCDGYIAEQKRMRAEGDPNALSERGLLDYERCLKNVCAVFGEMAPRAYKTAYGQQYLKKRKDQGCGVRANKEMSALSSAFVYGMTTGAVDENPVRGYRRNRETPRHRSVDVAELNAFLAFAKNRGGTSYLTAVIGCVVALTGRRRGEILRLPKTAITEAGVECLSNKNQAGAAPRKYLIEWTPTLRMVLTEALNFKHRRAKNRPPLVSGYLFHNRDGEPYTDDGFKTNWQKLMRAYAPDGPKSPEWFRAHDLRALYVSEMLGQGRDPNTHQNEATMRRVYDRRKVRKVSPLA
jgi:integrase